MKKTKRITAATLAVVMTLTVLSSCVGNEKKPTLEKRTNVYTGAETKLPDGVEYIQNMFNLGDNVGMLYTRTYTIIRNEQGEEVKRTPGYSWTDEDTISDGWTQDYESNIYIASYDTETCEINELPIAIETEGDSFSAYIRNVSCDVDGTPWALVTRWDYADDYEETYESTRTFRLYSFDMASGEITKEIILNDAIADAGLEDSEMYFYNFVCTEDGIYFNSDSTIIAIDKNGSFKEKIDIDEDGWINALYADGNALYWTFYPDNGSQKVKVIENGQISDIEGENLKGVLGNSGNIYCFSDSKMYYATSIGISAYDITTDTSSELLNYINSDIDTNNISTVLVLPDGRVAIGQSDWSSEVTKNSISVLTRVPDEELEEELILELGCLYTDYYLNKAIIRFNKQNTGVRISIRDYSQYSNEDNEWTGAATQFNNDIVIGNVPDLVLLSTSLPVESYFKKGLFTDLYKFIDDSEIGIDRADYLENIFKACEVDGKLNSMILSFTLNTLVAKSKYVGNEPGWTFDEMMDTIQNLPEGTDAFMECSRDTILDYMFTYSMDTFVDWKTGETYFNDTAFIEFIEYLATCSELSFWSRVYSNEYGEYEYDDEREKEFQTKYQLRFYKDYSLFDEASITSFSRIMNIRGDFATSDITFIGYPTNDENSNGATITPQAELAISAQSLAQEEAWSFIKFVLEDKEYAESLWMFTPNINSLNDMKQTAKDEYTYYEQTEDDLAWYKEYYSEEYYEYMLTRYQPLDESTLDQTMELLRGAYKVQRNDSSLLDIIKEELSAFFAGTRSAEETAKIIDSRARIYVSQNS